MRFHNASLEVLEETLAKWIENRMIRQNLDTNWVDAPPSGFKIVYLLDETIVSANKHDVNMN
jgi:hypothetical protein